MTLPVTDAERRDAPVSIDVVVPVFNEEAVLEALLDRLEVVFAEGERERHGIRSVRYLLVDDGSADASAAIIGRRIARGLPAVLYRLSRNFGHQHAVAAGLDHARADVVAVIDADLQDPPDLIPTLLAKWREGYDVVYGQRQRRAENPIRRAGYWLYYRLVAFLADVEIPLDSGDFCLLGRRVVDALRALPERLRFPRVLRAWIGFPQAAVVYDRPSRPAGRTKYTLGKLYRLATDGVVSASVRPLQVAQVFSVLYLGATLGLGGWLFLGSRGPAVPPLVAASILLILVGNFVQVFCIYILGAYVGRTYLEVKGRPPYLVMEVIGEADD